MGKPVKLSDQKKKWFLQRSRRQDRQFGFREERRRFLIVCEGAKTEPNYFNAFKVDLPQHTVELEVIGEGMNTLSLVARAQHLRDRASRRGYPYDEVWVVFDRDSFAADDFDNAIHKAQALSIQPAWSNEAFELWYILHFECRTAAMGREQYWGRLTQFLGQAYRKNSPDMYQQLLAKGNQAQAIGWARRLHEETVAREQPASRANPCTTVYLLVEKLNRFKPAPQ